MTNYNSLNSLYEFVHRAHKSMKKNKDHKTRIEANRSGIPESDEIPYNLTYTCPVTDNQTYKFEERIKVPLKNETEEVKMILNSHSHYIETGMYPSELEVRINNNYAELSIKNKVIENKKLYNQ